MKSVILDWSGVVKDAVGSHLWIVNRMFKKFGISEISLEELRQNWEQPYMLFYKKYIPNLSLEEQKKNYREAILSEECPKSESFPGIVELIKKLKNQRVYLAIVASDLPETVLPEIKEYGLENIFDEIFTNVHDKFETVRDLINKQNLDSEDTFFIGDSNHEIDVAKKAGINSVAVTWGFCSESRLKSSHPNFIAHNAEELEEIFS